ncbi:MAG: UPF0158 family protein [Deltaproteobacteria bacterium]|nr:UPF0158 family protein [Deltaproteobacteria bacterium]
MSSSKPRVSLSELIDVLDDAESWTRFHYVDRDSGAVETALTEEVDGDGNFADVRQDVSRFVPVKPLPKWVRLQVREQFVERIVDDPTLRLQLLEALRGPQPLLEFQKYLRRDGRLMDQFLAFRLQAFNDAANAWLDENKVRASLGDAAKTADAPQN